jgi:antitoxin (DNA-binding transcriptional repressor) of toxin-antitoxin stability system
MSLLDTQSSEMWKWTIEQMIQEMHTVTLHDAETRLPQLLEQSALGEAFIISKAGRLMVKVIPFDASVGHARQLGFMAGEISVPEDFDRMGSNEIAAIFV